MKPPKFSYYDPVELDDVFKLLAELENTKLLAGGQSLMPMLNMRYALPDHIIDLNNIPALSFIREHSDRISIGAMTRQRDLEFSPVIAKSLPLVRGALEFVGHRQTRNRGTIGGSLAHADPAAELGTVALALDAVVRIGGLCGERQVPIRDFLLGYLTTDIAPDELLLDVSFPLPGSNFGWGFAELSRRHGDFAIVSAAASLGLGADGRIRRASLVLGGVAETPIRIPKAEAALIDNLPSETLFKQCCAVCAEIETIDDALVSASYRKKVAPVLARRALLQASERLSAALRF